MTCKGTLSLPSLQGRYAEGEAELLEQFLVIPPFYFSLLPLSPRLPRLPMLLLHTQVLPPLLFASLAHVTALLARLTPHPLNPQARVKEAGVALPDPVTALRALRCAFHKLDDAVGMYIKNDQWRAENNVDEVRRRTYEPVRRQKLRAYYFQYMVSQLLVREVSSARIGSSSYLSHSSHPFPSTSELSSLNRQPLSFISLIFSVLNILISRRRLDLCRCPGARALQARLSHQNPRRRTLVCQPHGSRGNHYCRASRVPCATNGAASIPPNAGPGDGGESLHSRSGWGPAGGAAASGKRRVCDM